MSHASRNRNADMAEELFWTTLAHLQSQSSGFGMGRKYVGFPRRFKRVINVVDSTTIKLVANCMDWAKHRRRKAAAKCHMRLDLLRLPVIFRKICFGNRSDEGAKSMGILLSLITTAKRQGREPLAFLQTLLTDSPEAAEALLYRQAPDLDDSS